MDVFGGTTTLYFGTGRQPYLLLPIIPSGKAGAGRSGRRRGS
jgi:hypothetical protein